MNTTAGTRVAARFVACCTLAFAIAAAEAGAQTVPGRSTAPPPPRESVKDTLGRNTPRGTVFGFLAAARRGENAVARHYLNVPSRHRGAETLAHQLFVVLDARLEARLMRVSGDPEGSRMDPLAPDREVIGSIAGLGTSVEIVVERIAQATGEPIWLFSRDTLSVTPALYDEVTSVRSLRFVPRVLVERRLRGVRLFDWLAILLAAPAFYLAVVLLNRAVTPLAALVRRRVFGLSDHPAQHTLPAPARLLLVTLASRWLFAFLPLSLIVRQFLHNATSLIGIGALVWLLFRVTAEIELHLSRRLPRGDFPAAVSLLRAGRRVVDALVLLGGLLATLRHFGVDPTPVLAGLGVGGLAVALAAQKTLENVIAGASLIFDQAVRVGDYLKVAEIEGTVEHIGLRSTRIRTLHRSVVSVPNSQIANMTLETLSARDKFWFHPIVGLRYETTNDQMHDVIDGIRAMLAEHALVEGASVRVRLLRLGAFSLDVEVFAYVFARDWSHFLEIQEELLLKMSEIVHAAGTAIAFPSQTMYVAGGPHGLSGSMAGHVGSR